MLQHREDWRESERSVVDGERSDIVYSEIQVPDSCDELIFDAPALALVEHACYVAVIGAGIMWARYGEIGDEHVIVEVGHPVDCDMVGVGWTLFVVVLADFFVFDDWDQMFEVLFCVVEEVGDVGESEEEDIFEFNHCL